MTEAEKKVLEAQLDAIVEDFDVLRTAAVHNDLSDLPKDVRQSLVTRAVAAVWRITGPASTYASQLERIMEQNPALHVHTSSVIGVVKALRHDLSSGYLQSIIELVHGSVFADFLEMADHLHATGFKDPAAVVAGSTLESHLRELARKHGISVELAGKPKKADLLNADLQKTGAYSNLDQKNVTAWLGLRNKAAHGEYTTYSADQVALLIAGVRDFLTRTPA